MNDGSMHADDAAIEIREAWHRAVGAAAPADEIVDDLLARHAEPHRRYHTAEHVRWVLRHVDRLCAAEPGIELDRSAIEVAALFHDAVYDARSTTNEADSAVLAVDQLRRTGWAPDRTAAVAAMILATAGHLARNSGEAILLDADLAILGAEADEYASYVDAVRTEFSFVDEQRWSIGRSQVLSEFLGRERIYATLTMADEREQRARTNLDNELAALRRSH